ncbi:MAG: site-specific DNA-methyltransferase [Archangium sp.]|nr:site-specific DNA-methyltransferase [Archangium sp.]
MQRASPICVPGDSTDPKTWERALTGRKADALITDPPYCLLTRRRKGGDLRDKKDKKIDRGPVRRFEDVREFRAFTRSWLSIAVQHVTPDAPLVIWMNLLGRDPLKAAAKELGWEHVRGEFVWGKRTREGNSGEEILRVVETALVFSRTPAPPPVFDAPAIPWAAVAGYDDDGEATRWGSHPNHKPFGVLEPLIRTWSKPAQLVMDPFAGSGSIPAAAQKLGRQVACVELEADWAERVTARLNIAQG